MDFGKLFRQAWDLLWNNLFLVLLGVLAVLGGAGSAGSSQSRFALQGRDFQWRDLPRVESWVNRGDWGLPAAAAGGILALALTAILIGLLFWAVGTIARGGMIAGVEDLEESRTADFISAFQAGWEKGWQLLGIALVPAVPGLILTALLVGSLILTGGWDLMSGSGSLADSWSAFSPFLVLACLFIPAALILGLLRTFAERACMLEGRGVLASYQRGFEVLGSNLGSALLLFLLQIALSIVVGLMMLVPGILSALCCLLWPVLILAQAAIVTYYSILWTLAWRGWVAPHQEAA